MCVACCRSSTRRSQTSSPASGCLSSSTPGNDSVSRGRIRWNGTTYCTVPPRVCSQDSSLPGVSIVPDDGAEGLGEAGRLVENLHHLHAKRHHGELGLGHLPALQSRGAISRRRLGLRGPSALTHLFLPLSRPGGSGRQPVWHPGLSVCGALPELADPRAAVEGVFQATSDGRVLLLLRFAALDRQLCPHQRFRIRILPVLRLPPIHQVSAGSISDYISTDLRVCKYERCSFFPASAVLICTGSESRSVSSSWFSWVCSRPWPFSFTSTPSSVTGASISPASPSRTSSARSTT